MPLQTTIRAGISASMTAAFDHGNASIAPTLSADVSLANGTGANQADVLWADQRTLTASATEDLDVAGSLTGMLGGTVTMAKLKAIVVKAASGNTNDVLVSRPAANGVPFMSAAGDSLILKPGGVFVWVAPGLSGIAVTAGTGDLITFTNSAGSTSVTYDVFLVGTSA